MTIRKNSKIQLTFNHLFVIALVMAMNSPVAAAEAAAVGTIYGIGYREIEREVDPDSVFSSTKAEGIRYASYAGGTAIYVRADALASEPEANRVLLWSMELNQKNTIPPILCPPLSADDSFNSNTAQGLLAYRLPAVRELLGVPQRVIDGYLSLTFWLTVQAPDGKGQIRTLGCGGNASSRSGACKIVYTMSGTPVLFELRPPVVYRGSSTEWGFDPKGVARRNEYLKTGDAPLVNSKIDGSLVEFGPAVTDDYSFGHYTRKWFPTTTGDQPISNSSLPTMEWFTGANSEIPGEIWHCSYDNETCYRAKTVPVIYDISADEGYTSGGQDLMIKGYGFGTGTVKVTVDGVECKVLTTQEDSINCQTQSRATASDLKSAHQGGHGLRRTIMSDFAEKQWISTWIMEELHEILEDPSTAMARIGSRYKKSEHLALSLEGPVDVRDINGTQISYYGQLFRGWFVPPATTRYRFYMACDDFCKLKLASTPDDSSLAALEVLLYSDSWSSREMAYWKNDSDTRVTPWKTLQKGEHYQIAATHGQYGGGEHMAVAVEIEQTAMKGHYHAMREVQLIAIDADQKRDTTRVTVTNLDDGQYVLSFQNPTTLAFVQSGFISTQASAKAFAAAVRQYYRDTHSAGVDVTRKSYDAAGKMVEDDKKAVVVKRVYEIALKRLITGVSASNIQVAKTSTKANVVIELPDVVQRSSTPVTGSVKVKCVDSEGRVSYTKDIGVGTYYIWFNQAIMEQCPDFFDKMEVFRTGRYDDNDDYAGRGLYLHFLGLNADPGQFEFVNSDTDPLTGDNIKFVAETIQPYSTNLFYDPIPYEMLKTFETKPQVLVTVEGLQAACHNLTCDYVYIDSESEMQSYVYEPLKKTIKVEGVKLPKSSEITSLSFAEAECLIDETTSTEAHIECSLQGNPTCGDHVPVLKTKFGAIKSVSKLTPMTITCTATSATPFADLDILGNQKIIIKGTNFPQNLLATAVNPSPTLALAFTDAAETACIPSSTNTDTITCTTKPFKAASQDEALKIKMVINGQEVANTLSFKVEQLGSLKATQLTPASASPVLKTKITIQLADTGAGELNKADFEVYASRVTSGKGEEALVKRLNVLAVDTASKTVDVMFGGAPSGLYAVSIRHGRQGLIETSGLELTVGSTVTAISPSSGSIYGGTLITITGTNFGTKKTDNPVQLSFHGGVGSVDCFVISTTSTQITCRVSDGLTRKDKEKATLATFLRTSEEASCSPSICGYTFTSAVPTVTAMSSRFDAASDTQEVVVAGTGFSGDISSTELWVGTQKQVTKSKSATEAVFTLTNVTSLELTDIRIYFDDGAPAGGAIVAKGLTITPTFTSLDTKEGSVAGSLITARAPGVGVDTDVDLVYGRSSCTRSGCSSICESVVIEEYGFIKCQTKAKTITANLVWLRIGRNNNRANIACSNTDMTKCQYEQSKTGKFPIVVAVSKSAQTLSFAGSNFFASGYTAVARYCGATADSVSIDSATQVTATWTKGVPPCQQSVASGTVTEGSAVNDSDQSEADPKTTPSLDFVQTSSGIVYSAQIKATVDNPQPASSSMPAYQCSFAGGCLYDVEMQGLATSLKANPLKNYISVCDNECIYSDADSTLDKAKCRLPAISTVYSNAQFKIEEPHVLHTNKYFGSAPADVANLFDGNLMTASQNTQEDCTAGMAFKTDHVGILSKMKYFLGNDIKESTYAGHLRFQGSNDNQTYEDLYTADENVHSGWNYIGWSDAKEQPKYRYYRFKGSVAGSCVINEVELWGVSTIDSATSSYECKAELILDGVATKDKLKSASFQKAKTPQLVKMSPRYGSVAGGDVITFSGSNFVSGKFADYKIVIDGVLCPVFSATSTEFKCKTGPRPGRVPSSMEVFILGRGYVPLQGRKFIYTNLWSSEATWGGEFAPIEMDTILIPAGLNLLVDIDATPLLYAVIVEGSLILAPDADPNHHRTLDAHYIFVRNGTLEVGTEEYPYTSKITITMHGNSRSPAIPIYGNKVIGVRYGTLDMHGIKRTPTWTSLESTAKANSNTITLQEAVDWQVGEEIVIAPTSFEAEEAEKRMIKAIDNSNPSKPIITLDSALKFKHFAETQTFGDEDQDSIDMRAEVGLLSRNIIFRGDPETSAQNQYGAMIFMHSVGDDSLTARIEHIEVTDAGQAFKLGRYPIHFHMIGTVHSSYVVGNAVHQTYNRAFTMHGVSHLRLTDNVVYNSKGHSVFIEDAIERKNQIKRNLVMATKSSQSLLNTDQTPASFWITHPDNDFVDNHAAGSARYGYWYDLQVHSTGPSANPAICPENARVGTFRGNHAHSNGRYGLRIFHNMLPRKFPCKPIVYDSARPDDPFWQNPLITASFHDLTSWKNGRNGAIAEKVADVRFYNFKTADNILAGMEFSLTEAADNMAQINGGLVIGKSANTEPRLDQASPHGIITPRSENFTVSGVRFYNYNWADAAALGSCSHCFHPASTDSGARTVTFSKLYFDETVTKRIRYQQPHLAIYFDKDGSLTERGPKTWATPYLKQHELPECVTNLTMFDGVLCDATVQVRRLSFNNFEAASGSGGNLKGMEMFVLRYDDTILAKQPNKTAYELDRANYGKIFFKPKRNPANSWTFPVVTGHKYKVHWANTGVDFDRMQIDQSERWQPSDSAVYLVMNYTDVRALMKVTVGGVDMPSGSLPSSDVTDSKLRNGQNLLINTYAKEFHLAINAKPDPQYDCQAPPSVGSGTCAEFASLGTQIAGGSYTAATCNLECLKNDDCVNFVVGKAGSSKAGQCYTLEKGCSPSIAAQEWLMYSRIECKSSSIVLVGERCIGPCMEAVKGVPIEKKPRYWSKAASWPSGKVPVAGEDVVIAPGWNMMLDIADTPIFRMLTVNGRLTFQNDKDVHLHAKHIFVRAGELIIGSKDKPYEQNAQITLHGAKETEAIVYDNAIEAGNKLIANVGLVSMYGKPRKQKMTRLREEARKGDRSITVEPGLDLVAGDRIALAATSYDALASDQGFVESYDSSSGKLNLKSPLNHYHWGAAQSTGPNYNQVDMRGEVMLLSRNIKIVGEDIEAWGGQIVVSSIIEPDLTYRHGQLLLDNVEVYNCSQANTAKAAVRFEGVTASPENASSITNSVIHNGLGWGVSITSAANVLMRNNVIFSFKPFGVSMLTVSNITFDDNIVAHVYERDIAKGNHYVEKRAGVAICSQVAGNNCRDTHVTNNIVAGAAYAGYTAMGHDCGDYSGDSFKDNVAHSIRGLQGGAGAIIYPDPARPAQATSCYEGSYFTAYKCLRQGVTSYSRAASVRYSFMTSIDNALGFGMQAASGEGPQDYATLAMEFNDNKVYGETASSDCPDGDNDFCIKVEKMGLFPPVVSISGKSLHPTNPSSLPYEKLMSDSGWGGKTILKRNEFNGFKSRTALGKRSSVFGSAEYQADYIPMLQFSETKFTNIDKDALVAFKTPPKAWAVIDDCGEFPCTGPLNVLYSFKKSTWTPAAPSALSGGGVNFQLIANNPGLAPYVAGCSSAPQSNAYYCEAKSLGILLFGSLDEDRKDRMVAPVHVVQQGSSINVKLNAMMDHGWDGFYTSQKRSQRFPSIIDVTPDSTYDITYTGTPPNNQLFKLDHLDDVGMMLRIAYPAAGSYAVTIDEQLVPMNEWDDALQNFKPVARSTCGENRFLAIRNILEVYITAQCSLKVVPRNAIQAAVRMEWTLQQFYADGGTTTFAGRLAGSLGIHASTIKVVGVYEGSLVLKYDIVLPGQDKAAVKKLAKKQTGLFATGKVELGAPVLDVAASSGAGKPVKPVVSDGIVTAAGYTPVVITPTATNASWRPGDAVPQARGFAPPKPAVVQPDVQPTKPKSGGGVAIAIILLLCAAGIAVSVVFRERIMKEYRQFRGTGAGSVPADGSGAEPGPIHDLEKPQNQAPQLDLTDRTDGADGVELAEPEPLHIVAPHDAEKGAGDDHAQLQSFAIPYYDLVGHAPVAAPPARFSEAQRQFEALRPGERDRLNATDEKPLKGPEELEMSHHSPPREEEVDVMPRGLEPAPYSPAAQREEEVEQVEAPRPLAPEEDAPATEPQVWQQTPEREVEKGPEFYPEVHQSYHEVGEEATADANVVNDLASAAHQHHVQQMIRQFGGDAVEPQQQPARQEQPKPDWK